MLSRFCARINKQYHTPVEVFWETTCHPYHANGEERREGSFETNEFEARSWATHFVWKNPMGAVKIIPKNQ